jgi:AraC-like DNA-binding protein
MTVARGVHSFGNELRSCQLDGIRVSETLMPRGLRLEEHSHEAGQICFVLEGEYRERARDAEHRLYPGVLQFHSPGESHSNIFSTDLDVLTLLISIERERWIHVSTRRPVSADAVLRDCNRAIRGELTRLDEAGRAALEGWAMLSLSAVARRSDDDNPSAPPWLGDAVALISEHASEPISLGTVASAIGVHRATLAAAFRRFRNTSVGECIRHHRVMEVRRELVNSNKPLCEVATRCGFHDQAHMGRVFRKVFGISPGEYRTSHNR